MYSEPLLKLARILRFLESEMFVDEKFMRNDYEEAISNSNFDYGLFKEASFFITGGTGLIGFNLVRFLIYINKKFDLDLSITLLVRDVGKAKKMFESAPLCFVEGCVEHLPEMNADFDYIVHAASPTASKFFLDHPVETINIATEGTRNVLALARGCNSKGIVYLSSMEIYGAPSEDRKIFESDPAIIDLTTPRCSYPSSKSLCEAMCVSYASEYNLPVRILRLTQTFGPGVDCNDRRIFAEIARCVINKKDIVLATKGETKHSYLYTLDAVTAILTLLVKGEAGEAYNAANEDTYCSIKEMADLMASKAGINVRIEEDKAKARSFAPTLHMNLSTLKLQSLGWQPIYGLELMFDKMIASMR